MVLVEVVWNYLVSFIFVCKHNTQSLSFQTYKTNYKASSFILTLSTLFTDFIKVLCLKGHIDIPFVTYTLIRPI